MILSLYIYMRIEKKKKFQNLWYPKRSLTSLFCNSRIDCSIVSHFDLSRLHFPLPPETRILFFINDRCDATQNATQRAFPRFDRIDCPNENERFAYTWKTKPRALCAALFPFNLVSGRAEQLPNTISGGFTKLDAAESR